MRAAREQWQLEAQVNTTEHQEWRQRFDEQLASNTTEHRAFTQNSQVLLAEIARLWQRMAG
jgi:hypothetical protein